MKILVGLDGSEAAYNALRSACLLASKTRSYLTAFYVNEGVEYSPEETGWTSIRDRLAEELEAFGHEVIHKAYKIGKDYGVSLEGIISEGVPTVELLKYARAHGIVKLIALGHSGKGRGASEFVESTTKNITAQAGVPVFVTSSEIDVRSIVVAVEDSEASQRATEYAGRLATSLEATVGLIAFVPDTEAMLDEYRLIAEVPNLEKHIEASEKRLAEIIERVTTTAGNTLNSMGLTASSIVKRGRPDDIIAKTAGHDLLIIGLNGEPSQKRLSRIANKLLNSREINTIFVQ